MQNLFLEKAVDLITRIDQTQSPNIEAASDVFAKAIMNEGIIQAFGSGHSYAAAIEIVERAGGLFAAKVIRDQAMGLYEPVEGVGTILMRKVDVRPEDVVVVISHSGRNPLVIEVASIAKERGATVVAVTSLEASRPLKSRHSSGKLLYQIADVVLDTLVGEGDATIKLEGLDQKICPISSMGAAAVIQATILRTVQKLMENGATPDIRISANLDGGTENNLALQKKYAHRVHRI